MKKMISIVVALLLLMTLVAMPVSANGVTVEQRTFVQGEVGESIEVDIFVNDASDLVGAVEGTITYDKSVLDYTGVVLAADFAALDNQADETVYADENTGVIRFVGVSSVKAGEVAPKAEWFTLKFDIIGGEAGDATALTLSDLIVSNKTGSDVVSASPINASFNIITAENKFSSLEGATIKTSVETQAIRFQAVTDAATFPADATEFGIIMLPEAMLNGELTLDTPNVAVAKMTAEDAEFADLKAGATVFARLDGSTANAYRMNLKIVARSYVKVGDQVIYSHNDTTNGIENGMGARSVVSVSQAIAAELIDNGVDGSAVAAYLTKAELNKTEALALLQFCLDNWASL